MNFKPPTKLLHLTVFCFLFLIHLNVSANPCSQTIESINESIQRQDLLENFPEIHRIETVTTIIPRTGSYQRQNHAKGKLKELYEVEIDRLLSIHPIPNPYRQNSSLNLQEIKNSLLENGFNLAAPIQVGIMPNGTLRILAGHHRVEAMKQIGEKTIPVELFIWRAIDPRTRKHYEQNYFDVYRERFPELH